MTTALVYHPRYLEHFASPASLNTPTYNPKAQGAYHPERPDRLRAIIEKLQASPLWGQLRHLTPTPATIEQVQVVHDPMYVRRLRAACAGGLVHLDSDTYINRDSFDIALLAAGGVIAAIDAVMIGVAGRLPDGQHGVRNAFCALRPPGHHAERDRAMGFCLLNNVAIGAAHLLQHYHHERVAIVDFDVHHGNGTQHLFEHQPEVFFISIHQHPRSLYPGSGYVHEKGLGRGEGHTLNLPLDPGGDDQTYRRAFLQQVLPALDQFRPQFVLLSAGFDASRDDPLAHMKVTTDGFMWMTRQLKMVAERHAAGRLVSVLEGGYDLRALSENVLLHVGQLMQPEGHDDIMAMKAGVY